MVANGYYGCPKCPTHVLMWACLMSLLAHCSDDRHFADSGEMCNGIVILCLVLALAFVQERQDNRHQHLIHYHYD